MELWSPEHIKTLIPATLIMLVISVALRLLLGKKDLEVRTIPLKIVACIFILLEIGKQGISLYKGYDLYHLPFHFCSMLITLPFAMAFYRGKYQSEVAAITCGVSTATAVLTLIYPCLIYSADNIKNFFSGYFDFHTVAFHNLVIFAAFLIPALNLHKPAKKGEVKVVLLYIICFCVISATMAQLLQTNFNNFYSCNIAPLQAVRMSIEPALGYGLTQALYIAIVTVLDIGFVFGSYWLYRLVNMIVNKKERVA